MDPARWCPPLWSPIGTRPKTDAAWSGLIINIWIFGRKKITVHSVIHEIVFPGLQRVFFWRGAVMIILISDFVLGSSLFTLFLASFWRIWPVWLEWQTTRGGLRWPVPGPPISPVRTSLVATITGAYPLPVSIAVGPVFFAVFFFVPVSFPGFDVSRAFLRG